eukprot:15328711-Ditylum_brightwellii.AAC.1
MEYKYFPNMILIDTPGLIAAGIRGTHYGVNFLRASCVIATEKAQILLLGDLFSTLWSSGEKLLGRM